MKRGKKQDLGSIVLGLNDALVELTGALTGLTLALQNSRIIAVVGLITGIAASMSMAASEYLSMKAEGNGTRAGRSALYTGVAYIITVLFLVFPYMIVGEVYYALIWTLVNAVIVIFVFTYTSFDKKSFSRRFFEMLFISAGVAAVSFGLGYSIRKIFGVDV